MSETERKDPVASGIRKAAADVISAIEESGGFLKGGQKSKPQNRASGEVSPESPLEGKQEADGAH